jgi:hypothetical protein
VLWETTGAGAGQTLIDVRQQREDRWFETALVPLLWLRYVCLLLSAFSDWICWNLKLIPVDGYLILMMKCSVQHIVGVGRCWPVRLFDPYIATSVLLQRARHMASNEHGTVHLATIVRVYE